MAKILLVDDEEVLTAILRECLLGEGHGVVVCHDSMAAARTALQENPDLAIVDYQMPGKTGVEVLADLRAQPETSRLPVLFLSGTDALRFAGKIPLDSRVRFLAKPMDTDVLTAAIREMLDPNGWSAPL